MLGEVMPHNGCQALYHLEADGTDSSGNGLHLTMRPSARFAAGKFGNGLSYNDNEYAIYNGHIGVNLGTMIFGVSFWFKISYQPDEDSSYRFIWWADTSNNFVGIGYIRPHSEPYKIFLTVDQFTPTTANFTATVGQWYKCDVTSDGTYNYLYINGVQYIKQAPGSYTRQGGATVSIFGVGYFAVSGMMDEVAFFNYHRTEQDIARQYAFEMGLL